MIDSGISFPEGSRFLVTGGAGFIGSNLCETITGLGYFVRCLDDLSTGFKENVGALCHQPNFAFMQGDIKSLDTCERAMEGIDYVLHQAAWGSVPRSIEMPLFYGYNNIMGTLNMLEAARRHGVRKFVYASSSSVYGDEETLPKHEGKEGHLLSPYALTKHTNEEYARLYAKLYGLETIGLRYFNVFGKRQSPDGAYAAVIPRFIKQLMQGQASVIHGDGLQSRDFTYIDNAIEANLKACLASYETAGEVFNVAYGGQVTILEVYQTIEELLGITIAPVYKPPRKGDIRHSHADISKARRMLGYAPKWDFASGIREAIRWYVDNI